jgi:hypothetical protein
MRCPSVLIAHVNPGGQSACTRQVLASGTALAAGLGELADVAEAVVVASAVGAVVAGVADALPLASGPRTGSSGLHAVACEAAR